MNIIVNGEKVAVDKTELTYEEIVAMVYQATVTYHAKLEGDATRQGILSRGRKVMLAEGMVISCMMTGAA